MEIEKYCCSWFPVSVSRKQPPRRKQLCPWVLWPWVEVLQPQQGDVGRKDLSPSTKLATLGQRLLQVLLWEWQTPHWSSQLHLYLLLFQARTWNSTFLQWLASHRHHRLSVLPRDLCKGRNGVWRRPGEGKLRASRQTVPQRPPALLCASTYRYSCTLAVPCLLVGAQVTQVSTMRMREPCVGNVLVIYRLIVSTCKHTCLLYITSLATIPSHLLEQSSAFAVPAKYLPS